ncbi:MAG: ATP-binding protein [Candidatus Muiribacteriota bacterium]
MRKKNIKNHKFIIICLFLLLSSTLVSGAEINVKIPQASTPGETFDYRTTLIYSGFILSSFFLIIALLVIFQYKRKVQSEKKYSKRSLYLESIIENLPVPVFLKNDNFQYKAVNRTFEKTLEVQLYDFKNKTSISVLSEEINHIFNKKEQELLNNPEKNQVYEGTLDLWGNRKSSFLFSKSLFIDENTDEKYIIGIITDISAVRQYEYQLDNSKQVLKKFSTAIQNSPVTIMITDIKGKIEYVNNHFEQTTGYKPEEVIGRKPSVLKSGLHNKTFYQNMWKTIISGKKFSSEIMNKKKDGTIYIEEAKISPVFNQGGEIINFVAVKEDVTEKIKLQEKLYYSAAEAENANKAKSIFLANMSHEIRTPLNGIIGLSDLLLETELNQQQEEFTRMISQSGSLLITIINDVLDFSKIEHGKMKLYESQGSIHELIKTIMKVFNYQIEEKQLKLNYYIAEDVPEFFLGDKTRLSQILINLVSNAVKFTDKGEVFLEVTKEEEAESDIKLKFLVRDTGIGINKNLLPKLFDSFSQAEEAPNKKYGGSGLGLAISKKLIQMMGGRIWVESSEGNGSSFYFTVMLKKLAPGEVKNELKIGTEEKRSLKKLKILVAEDNQINQKYLVNVLKSKGNKVEIANNGEEAVEIYQKRNFDLILMDIHMPKVDGVEAAYRIRKIEKEKNLPNIPIIALTADAMNFNDEKFKGKNFGINEVVTKPFKVSQLYEKINKVCSEDAVDFNLLHKIEKGKYEEDYKFKIIDYDTLKEFIEDAPIDSIIELIESFHNKRDEFLENISEAVKTGNNKDLAHFTHKFLGIVSFFHAKPLNDIIVEMQNVARENKNTSEEKVKKLKKNIDLLTRDLIVLKKILKES